MAAEPVTERHIAPMTAPQYRLRVGAQPARNKRTATAAGWHRPQLTQHAGLLKKFTDRRGPRRLTWFDVPPGDTHPRTR